MLSACRNNGKSDTLDAEAAARSVLAGIATAVHKTADGSAVVRLLQRPVLGAGGAEAGDAEHERAETWWSQKGVGPR